MRSKRIMRGAWHHVYSITKDGGVLFYRISDRLCFYTIVSVCARRFNMIVLGLCLMFTHFHMMLRAVDLAHLRAFFGTVLSIFTRVVNADRRRSGALFKRPFGRAMRVSDKEKRSSIIYLLNNPVEKHLVTRAVEDRWTFLAHCGEAYPFTPKLVKRNVSFRLRCACDYVDGECAAGRYLIPSALRRLFKPLTRAEQEQLCDYIIDKYSFIAYNEVTELFDGERNLMLAAKASAGKEFDVGEAFDPSSDIPYREMAALATRNGLFEDWKLLHLEKTERDKLQRLFLHATSANEVQVRKFFHCL
ncbi:MAG: hypothetical protein GXY24_06315 [Bacteroidales bacterium]|nr:hypothetical protein [Bacteroidales bacterium]